MKDSKLSELSLEELNKQKKTLKGVLIGFGIVMLLAWVVLLYLVIKNHNFALVAIIPAGMLTLFPSIIRLNQLNTEIKSRLPK